MEELMALHQAVSEMREAQKEYFKTRSKVILQDCKTLEKKVDSLLIKIENLKFQSIHYKSLFDENKGE